MTSLTETENLIKKKLMPILFSSKKILVIAVIYSATRKAPPSKELIADIIKTRYNISPDFSSSQGTKLVMRKLNPEQDMGIDRNPGDALVPLLAKPLQDTDLSDCHAVAYKDFDETLNAWSGALFIGIVAQA